jgi:predicted nuclease of predicted toxin-antitoxin system
MRLLVDQNLSRRVAAALRSAGHDVVHTSEVELSTASDDAIASFAAATDRVVVSADTDFGTLLAITGASQPSVVLVRLRAPRPAEALAAVVIANLEDVSADLESGAIVVLEDERVRIRPLPLR